MPKEKVQVMDEFEEPMAAPVEEIPEEGDSIRISENVISSVIRRYTLEVEGVIRFASGSIAGSLAEIIGRKNQDSAIVVDIDGDKVNVAVTLVLQFGVPIPDVASEVQNTVRAKVEELTGKQVNKVDVIVQDLEEEPTPEEKLELESGVAEV